MTDTEKSKQGKRSRERGKRAELELANLIRDVWGYDTHRGKVFYHESDVVGLKGIHMEVKRVERLNIHAAMEQAIKEAEKRQDGIPAVFYRKNRGEWMVNMSLIDWMDLYGAWIDEG